MVAGVPSLADMARYQPRWLGVMELNIGDQWRARWVSAEELPADAPVIYAYAAVFMDGKGYATRPAGSDAIWGIAEGPRKERETPEAFVKRLAQEQVGAAGSQLRLIGFLECKATSHNHEVPAGTMTVRPIYIVNAKTMKDLGRGSAFERRRLPLNEFAAAVRVRYPELEQYLGKALDQYAILRGKGEL